MIKQSDSNRKVLLSCAIAATLIGASVPAFTSAHWVFSQQAIGGNTKSFSHSSPTLTGRAKNYPIGTAGSTGPHGTCFGDTPTNRKFNISVKVNCLGQGESPWSQVKFDFAPMGNSWHCGRNNQADWTQGAIAD